MAVPVPNKVQDRLVASSIDSLDEGRDVLLIAPTGGGKTLTFSLVAIDRVEKDEEILILANRQRLVRQTAEKLGEHKNPHVDVTIGIDGSIDQSGNIVVSTIQTAFERKANLKRYDLVVIDEAHHAMREGTEYPDVLAEILKKNPDCQILAATGTPPPHIERLHDRLTTADRHIMTFEEAIAERLVDLPETVMPRMHYKTHENVQTVFDRHREKGGIDLTPGISKDLRAIRDDDWADQLVDKYERELQGRKTLSFHDNISDATKFLAAMSERGHPTVIMHSRLSSAENNEAMQLFDSGKVPTLISVDMISEGADLDCTGILLDKTTTSSTEYRQIIGRGARSHGADRLIKTKLVDTGASTLMHGDIGAQAAMQTLRGNIEQHHSPRDVLPHHSKNGQSPWIPIDIGNGQLVYGTALDGHIIYAQQRSEQHYLVMTAGDKKTRLELLDITGQRKGQPSVEAFSQWVAEKICRNEHALARLMSDVRGENLLKTVIMSDWEKNGPSVKQTAEIMKGSVVSIARAQDQGRA